MPYICTVTFAYYFFPLPSGPLWSTLRTHCIPVFAKPYLRFVFYFCRQEYINDQNRDLPQSALRVMACSVFPANCLCFLARKIFLLSRERFVPHGAQREHKVKDLCWKASGVSVCLNKSASYFLAVLVLLARVVVDFLKVCCNLCSS